MNSFEYWEEIRSISDNLVSECMEERNTREEAEELIQDSRLHESVDGHRWVIYYSYNLDIIKHTSNEDYMIDNFGGEALEQILRDSGLDGLHSTIAFWSMYADVQEDLERAFNGFEEELD